MNDRQTSQDLWHLTIDDLFAAPAETPRLDGDGPFVINLSTSTAPISIPPKSHISFDRMHVYQVTRTEEGRQRFRLRLGPISTQLEADAILAAVRERYPSAMPASVADDDLRAIASATRIAQAARPQKKPAAKPAEPNAISLPPIFETLKQEESSETTGTRWDLDALLPHLSAQTPAPRAKKPAPKKAPVARSATPTASAAKAQPVAKSPTPPPSVAAPPIAPAPIAQPIAAAPVEQPIAAAPTEQPITASPVTPSTAAAQPAPTKQVAKAPLKKAVSPPPVLTVPVEPRPKTAAVPTPPVLTVPVSRAKPAQVAPPTPPPAAQQAPPPVVAKAAAPVVAREIAATEVAKADPTSVQEDIPAPVVEQSAPLIVARIPEPVVEKAAAADVVEIQPAPAIETAAAAPALIKSFVIEVAAPPPAAQVVPSPAIEPPATKSPVEVQPAPLPPAKPRMEAPIKETSVAAKPPAATLATPVAQRPSAPPPAPIKVPQMDPLETDWAAILSAPVEDTASRPILPIACDQESARAPVAETSAPAVPPAAASEDSGLRRLVEKSNAIVASMDTPAADFSPTSTQTIEEKLAKLSQLLDDGHKPGTPATPPSVEQTKGPTTQTHSPPVLSPPTTDVDIDIPLQDDLEPESGRAKPFWPEIERRAERRPTLKSPTEVLSSIEQMVVVDEANNLENLVAKSSDPKIDWTAETASVPILSAPALKVEAELALETELTLAPAEPAPPPKLIEDLLVIENDRSLEVLVQKSNTLVESLVKKAEAPVDVAPAVAGAAAEKSPEPKLIAGAPSKSVAPPVVTKPAPAPASVATKPPAEPVIVPTVVLDKAAQAEEPHVKTIVLDKARQAEEPHVPTVVLAEAPVATAESARVAAPRGAPHPGAQAAPVVIRTRPTAFEQSVSNAAHLTARAAARAAKKLRAAKHAAKQAAHTLTSSPKTPAPVAKPSAPAARVPTYKAPVPLLKGPDAPASKSTPPAAGNAVPTTPPAPVAPAAAAATAKSGRRNDRKVEIRTEHSAAVDSTQTMRALTPLELADDQASKWFVIQLALAEDDFDPEHIPHLDIFEAYRLYAVIGLDQNRIMHALRLGFFSDEISAQAVHGYIKTHFESATITRVSIAERERFAERQVLARKDIGATGMHAIIEMASPTPVPETRLADLAASSGQGPQTEKSIWSRLVSPLKR